MQSYQRGKKTEINAELTDEVKRIILENVDQNVVELAQNNPNVNFYFYYSPYSIVWWDRANNNGQVNYNIESMEILAEEVLKCKNIKLFDFCSDYDLVCNLNNYKDLMHYSAEINSKILNWMAGDEYLLTKGNYKEHFEELRSFYLNYDYDKFFADLNITMEME